MTLLGGMIGSNERYSSKQVHERTKERLAEMSQVTDKSPLERYQTGLQEVVSKFAHMREDLKRHQSEVTFEQIQQAYNNIVQTEKQGLVDSEGPGAEKLLVALDRFVILMLTFFGEESASVDHDLEHFYAHMDRAYQRVVQEFPVEGIKDQLDGSAFMSPLQRLADAKAKAHILMMALKHPEKMSRSKFISELESIQKQSDFLRNLHSSNDVWLLLRADIKRVVHSLVHRGRLHTL